MRTRYHATTTLRLAIAAAAAAMAMQPASAQQAAAPGPALAEEVIIVTATLRDENLQQVPIAVSAYDASALSRAGVKDIRNLDAVSASYAAQTGPTQTGATTLRIRGVGTTGNNTGLESAVGVFLDGVYQSRAGIALGDLMDVEQVELLRGPQGTLFGRNTSAGALHIKTRKPNLEETDGFINATYGNYDLMNIQTGVSTPVGDNAGVRLSGAWRQRDGYLRNATGGESNDRDRYILRGQYYIEPSDSFSLRVIADYSKIDEKCCDAVIIQETSYVNGPFAANGLPGNGGAPNTGERALDKLRTSNGSEFADTLEQYGLSVQADWDVGSGTLTSITAYRESKANPTTEPDFVTADVFSLSSGGSTASAGTGTEYTRIENFTQELRFTGSWGDRLDYLIGAFYADEKISELKSTSLGADYQSYMSTPLSSIGLPPNSLLTIFAGGVSAAGATARNQFDQDGSNWAIFTNNTFHMTDRVAINLGLRYSDDHKEGRFDQLDASNPACGAVAGRAAFLPAPLQALVPVALAFTCQFGATPVGAWAGAPQEFDETYNEDELVWTAKLLGQITDDVNAYLSASHGYKAGGFNLDPTAAVFGADPSFKPETVDALEVGLKSQWLDGRVTANLAVFQQELEDFQVLEFTGTQFRTFNVEKAESKGFELELGARITDGLSASLGLTYADAKYPGDCGGDAPPAAVALLCGQDLTSAPEWVAVAGFNWQHDLGSNLMMSLAANLRWEDDRRTGTQALQPVLAGTGTEGPGLSLINAPYDIQDSFTKVNLRAAIGDRDGQWMVEVWANNLFDEQTYAISANTPFRGIPTLPGPFNAGGIGLSRVVFPEEPRTYGLTVSHNF